LNFDRRTSLRRIKPQRRAAALCRREASDLPLVPGQPPAGRELLLDTCVYIDVLQGRTPAEVDRLLQMRIVNHSTTALSELTHLYGALDPEHSGTSSILRILGQTIDDIPMHRLTTPSARAYAEAGMLAGLVTRLTGQQKTVSLLNDALLFLHAAETGCALLSRNVRDFDWFDQVLPGSSLLLYRA
jgi:predicted nucleic acid-binding protein